MSIVITCANCGQTFTGSHACPNNFGRQGLPLTTFAPGWKCPVCGAGCAPWRSTHCDPTRGSEVGPSSVTGTTP